MLGGYLCDYSQGRYGFIVYAIIPLISIVLSWRMSDGLEKVDIQLVIKNKDVSIRTLTRPLTDEEEKKCEELIVYDR